MAARVAGMTPEAPPRWLEWALLRFLPVRDRETVSGDLLEEYREEQVPRLGSKRANLWYLRQSMSFASIRIIGGPHLRQLLLLMSVFLVAAGIWLAVMENIQKHGGYSQRSMVAVGIAMQGLATLLYVIFDGRAAFRLLVSAGAVGIGFLGIWAIRKIMLARHFEGFVLLIGLGLLIQSVLTLMLLCRGRYSRIT